MAILFTLLACTRKETPLPMQEVPVITDNPKISRQDQYIDSEARKLLKDRPNLSFIIGVVNEGKSTLYAYGSIDKSKPQLPSANTLYEIGELSAAFTCIAAIEKFNSFTRIGNGIDDAAGQYIEFPSQFEFKLHNSLITIRDLIVHNNILSDLPTDITVGQNPQIPLKHYTINKLIDFVVKSYYNQSLSNKYSRINYALLGRVLEKLYGQSFENLFHDEIRPPLGMMGSKVSISANEYNYPIGYDEKDQPVPHWDDLGAFKSAMSVKATAADMLHFLELLINPGQNSWAKSILAYQKLDFYFDEGRKATFDFGRVDSGNTTGFSASYCYNIDQKKGVVFLSNYVIPEPNFNTATNIFFFL